MITNNAKQLHVRGWSETTDMFVTRSIATGHQDLIHDVSYDFHGRRMATCSTDQNVQVQIKPNWVHKFSSHGSD